MERIDLGETRTKARRQTEDHPRIMRNRRPIGRVEPGLALDVGRLHAFKLWALCRRQQSQHSVPMVRLHRKRLRTKRDKFVIARAVEIRLAKRRHFAREEDQYEN